MKEIARFLQKSYNIDSAQAKKDVRRFIKELKKRGLVCKAGKK
jgi:hypothetical protein